MMRVVTLTVLFAFSLGGCAERVTEVASVPSPVVAPVSTGSGVAVHPDGLVLTSYHVVRDAGIINV